MKILFNSFNTNLQNETIFEKVNLSLLNIQQKKWFDLVNESCLNDEQLLMIVNGSAGTGKSFTIAAITGELGQDVVGRAAFTARAAHLIHGRTLHGLFKLPTGRKKFAPLKGDSLKSLRETLKGLKVLIIDEFSMLSQIMLDMVNQRLKQVCHKCFIRNRSIRITQESN